MKIIELPGFAASLTAFAQAKTFFDPVRRKSVAATPEEAVRQALLLCLIREKGFPRSLLGVETALKVNTLLKRCDVVAYKNTQPLLLAECKAPSVKISQDVFDQIARYNLALQVPYLLVTNGAITLCCEVDLQKKEWRFLDELPEYSAL